MTKLLNSYFKKLAHVNDNQVASNERNCKLCSECWMKILQKSPSKTMLSVQIDSPYHVCVQYALEIKMRSPFDEPICLTVICLPVLVFTTR